MKLDVTGFRYITKEEFRVLSAVEMGMKNHEHVPTPLIESISHQTRGACYKILCSLLRHKLVAHDGKKYDGYRLTYGGYDYLAVRALALRGTIVGVGRRLGVGKESDVHYAQAPNGDILALKLHRLGRVSFRAIKSKRDYLKGRESASWQYMARLAAVKEFAYMKALRDQGFTVPTPVDQNRHCVVMGFLKARPLYHIRHLNSPHLVLERLMRMLVRLARAGVVHGDYNEFNLMIDDDEKVTLIDFPQIVHVAHPNAEEFFDRDVQGVRDFFRKRLGIEVERWPTWAEAIAGNQEAKAAGDEGISAHVEGLDLADDELLVAAHNGRKERDPDGEEQQASDDDGEGGESEEEEEEQDGEAEEGAAGPGQLPVDENAADPPQFESLMSEGCQVGHEEDLAAEAQEAGQAEQAPAGEESSEGEESEEEPVGQVQAPSNKRVRRKHTAKDAKASLQKQHKKPPAKSNNQKCKEMRKARAEIKEWGH